MPLKRRIYDAALDPKHQSQGDTKTILHPVPDPDQDPDPDLDLDPDSDLDKEQEPDLYPNLDPDKEPNLDPDHRPTLNICRRGRSQPGTGEGLVQV